jgi:hypothetical protein
VDQSGPTINSAELNWLDQKARESVSVLDFGADPTGVADSTAAFTAAASASKNPVVPSNATFLLKATPTLGSSIFSVGANTAFIGAGASAMAASGTGLQELQTAAGPTDYATRYVRRNATYIGGTAGYVNAGIRSDVYVSSGVTDYEWAVAGVMNNSATGGQNVGGYFQGNKNVANAGPTWGGLFDLQETIPINNPTTGSVAAEIDNRSNGTDSNNERIGVDVVIARYNPTGANTEAGWAYRVQTGRDLGVTVKVGYGFDTSNTNVQVGFDTSTATMLQAAYKLAMNQVIAFDASAINTLAYDGTGINYSVSGAEKIRLDAEGAIELIGTHSVVHAGSVGTSSGTAPVLTANKPGASTGIGAWLSVTIDGSQFWIPAWSN